MRHGFLLQAISKYPIKQANGEMSINVRLAAPSKDCFESICVAIYILVKRRSQPSFLRGSSFLQPTLSHSGWQLKNRPFIMKFSFHALLVTAFISIHTAIELVLSSPINLVDHQLSRRDCNYRVFCPTSLAESWCVSWDTGYAMCVQKNGKYPTVELNRCKSCVESNCATTRCEEVMD
ncbi:hypothetical protein I7I53_03265 [Histoplasma capsulatum var. duboisii H88]|uniref:Uncharacterized protein n=1 Tax=Ajellomyces capsulatus (strain H88) TaxID=544711 RepID=A0A8A1LTV7_AJEC8|nr:hypothetical protein I7I53_03265 [Histoplasma capsulatum var. duboisii H88]